MSSISFSKSALASIKRFLSTLNPVWVVAGIALVLSVAATLYAFNHDYIVAYGDAESHLNIAKRVVSSLTPGFAQLGGIWLPLPHLFMIPFVYFDPLWRSGLAGSIVSGIAYIVSAVYIYKLCFIVTKHRGASVFASLVFMLNPNMLYMQATPMTELVLVVFFVLSSYYFIRFLETETILHLLLAAFFGFCASLSRYDGWGLVLMEAGVILLYYLPLKINLSGLSFSGFFLKGFYSIVQKKYPQEPMHKSVSRMTGTLIIFCSLAFFGVALWLLWDYVILGDPLYFTHSQFSAKSQQQSWHARGELPAYKNIYVSFIYYLVTSMSNIGVVLSLAAIAGLVAFMRHKENRYRTFTLLVLFVPFLFNVATLYLGQSVIFMPGLTPTTFEWTLFNVRYGLLMVPFAAFCIGYLFYLLKEKGRIFLGALIVCQLFLFYIGYSPVITLADGTRGLSSQILKLPDAQFWLAENYDYGLVLTDDFARTISIVRTPIKMQDDIYVGNKPYWEESLNEPEKYARWIVMQRDDTVWNSILGRPEIEARLFKYFNKVYTSEDILIFRKID